MISGAHPSLAPPASCTFSILHTLIRAEPQLIRSVNHRLSPDLKGDGGTRFYALCRTVLTSFCRLRCQPAGSSSQERAIWGLACAKYRFPFLPAYQSCHIPLLPLWQSKRDLLILARVARRRDRQMLKGAAFSSAEVLVVDSLFLSALIWFPPCVPGRHSLPTRCAVISW